MSDPDKKIHSTEELENILAMLFAANGIDINEVVSAEETLYMDPRNKPESEWIDYSSVPIPQNVAKYIDSCDTITRDETNAIEIALEKFYGITPGWFITLSSECEVYDNTQDSPKVTIIKPLRFLLCKHPDEES